MSLYETKLLLAEPVFRYPRAYSYLYLKRYSCHHHHGWGTVRTGPDQFLALPCSASGPRVYRAYPTTSSLPAARTKSCAPTQTTYTYRLICDSFSHSVEENRIVSNTNKATMYWYGTACYNK